MIKIELKKTTASISVDSNSPFEPDKIIFDCSSETRKMLEHRLSFAYGAFGHSFNIESATPIDLHYAVMTTLAEFDPQVVEGSKLVSDYDPGIPEDAET